MALLVKNVNVGRTSGPTTGAGQSVLGQYIHVLRPAALVPQTTTDIIFRVYGGKVLVHLLWGEVSGVAISSTDPVLKVSSKALDATSTAVGTAVDVASTVSIASLEIGGNVTVLGSGAALVKNNAGAGIATLGRIPWIAPQGEIYLTAGASSTTGKMQWEIFYQPLTEGAYVVANGTQTVI